MGQIKQQQPQRPGTQYLQYRHPTSSTFAWKLRRSCLMSWRAAASSTLPQVRSPWSTLW
jgi:hypothetical protein